MKDKLQSRRQYLQNTDLKQNGIQNMQTPQENKQPNLKISRRSGLQKTWASQWWQIYIWKDAPHHRSSGNCELEQQWHTSPYLHTKIWHGWGSTEFPIHAGRNSKRYIHFGRRLGSFSQNKIYSCHMIQQLWSLVSTQRSWKLMSEQKQKPRQGAWVAQ